MSTVHPADDVVNEVLNLFGSVPNALRCLRLTRKVTYQQAYRCFRGEAVDENSVAMIQDAWRSWKRQFLLSHVLLRDDYNEFVLHEDEDEYERELHERLSS